ncbi:hypothetical protein W97_04382 [Coniosporium apollinis CBS 100218]|uniref:Heterokaryon incompatibility domain-containing protein n=1 Tax=Coniosporium apollinis (strain CBS 100218) TaxID=1168221 RepID=R7YTD6_CONA1|nr:uncharacterized protein W97_04382 [Coniosporium apollinis CBS 100218]EON65145.1 hypothetical protein W97_04382 [Coniosporium apollinis CBS 100218]
MDFISSIKTAVANAVNNASAAASSQSVDARLAARDLFTYTALPLRSARSIRLLELHPGAGDIVCSLHTVDLDTAPPYDALSYTWGDARPPLLQSVAPQLYSRRFPISCNGCLLEVTANLYHALQRLVAIDRARPRWENIYLQRLIWIDAICINQEDDAEKSTQVAMMEDIYKRASLVVCWLGQEDRYTEPALRLANYLAQIPSENYGQYSGLGLNHSGIPSNDWEALVALFRRPCFRRAWITQEIVLAQKLLLLCGSFEISWSMLVKCSEFVCQTQTWRHLFVMSSRFSSIQDYISRRELRPVGVSVQGLAHIEKQLPKGKNPSIMVLMMGRGTDASNPRDNVYALLGLTKEMIKTRQPSTERSDPLGRLTLSQLPVPDYKKPVERVYSDFAKCVLECTQNLLLLSLVEDRSDRRSAGLANSLPSWVPDLSVPLLPMPLAIEGNAARWDAAGPGSAGQGIALDKRYLLVNGAYFDTIAGVGDPFHELESSHNWLSILNLVRPLISLPYPTSGGCYAEALWRSIIADLDKRRIDGDRRQSPADPTLGQAFGEWLVSKLIQLRFAALDKFGAQSYFSMNWKLVQETWNQFLDDPSALRTDMETYKKSATERHEHHRTVKEKFDATWQRKEEFAGLYRAIFAALTDLSQADPSGTILPPENVLRILIAPDSREKEEAFARIETFTATTKGITSARRLFLTRSGYLGITAEAAQVNDQIWILPGTSVPFTLRPGQSNGRFQVVGEAYVYGLMRGEAAAAGGLQFQDIELE